MPINCKLILFALVLGCVACGTPEEIVYFQNIENQVIETDSLEREVQIQKGDLLLISVSSTNLEAVQPFNPGLNSNAFQNINTQNVRNNYVPQNEYLVLSDGSIIFPVLGKITAAGKSREELRQELVKAITPYVKDVMVNIRISNFKVTVLGEVARPGTFRVEDEQITLPQALGLAGDLTILGMRDNILIIREKDGNRTYNRVDLTDSNIIKSPYFILKQNDIVYVTPNEIQVRNSKFDRSFTSILISLASLTVTVLVLLFR
ncbi:MAG: polysaccharide biosynthesis/export family protein [Flavobacteriaceae bacterium]|nr:polysaccharide biosynthesis/export family protein [Flavobacteriaceae bacterium]